MDKSSFYIQKLIILLLVLFIGSFLYQILPITFLLPILSISSAYMVSRITGEKPPYLWRMFRTDEFIDRKTGLWILSKWILSVFGFIYDLIVWAIYGIFVFFSVIIDMILLAKTVIYWLIYAIIWFLKQFVPPLIFLYKMLIYYGFRWSWWIYKLSFRNIIRSFNINFYIIALYGTLQAIFIITLFYGVGLFINLSSFFIIGLIFAILPIIWSYGEISSLRFRKTENDNFLTIRRHFRSGIETVKSVLFYVTIFLFILLSTLVFNLLGWIPQAGYSFMGLGININTLASLILLFIFIFLVFALFIFPPFIVIKEPRKDLKQSIELLGIIGKKFPRFMVALLPTSIFSCIISFIPALLIFLSIVITLNIKDKILDTRISMLQQRQMIYNGIEKYRNTKNIERLEYYKQYPKNIFLEVGRIKELKDRLDNLKENLTNARLKVSDLESRYTSDIDSINNLLTMLKSSEETDIQRQAQISVLEKKKNYLEGRIELWKDSMIEDIQKLEVDVINYRGLLIQLPIVFVLTIIWISICTGLILAVVVAYLGNAYFELYQLKEDGKPSYCSNVLTELNLKNHNQPLLGFTLLAILILLIIFFLWFRELNWHNLVAIF